MNVVTPHPGHPITITPIGPAFDLECTCGLARRFASKPPAVRAGIDHHHAAGGCNCPDDVQALPEHTVPRPDAPRRRRTDPANLMPVKETR